MTARALGAVAFATIGAVLLVASSWIVLAEEFDRVDLQRLVVGGALLVGARGLAGLVLPDDPDARIDRVAAEDLHATAFAMVGLWGTLVFVWGVLQTGLPWVLGLDESGVFWVQLRYQLPSLAVPLLLLWKSRALARLWWRAQRPAGSQ